MTGLDASARRFLLQLASVVTVMLVVPPLLNSGVMFLAGLVCINAVVALGFNLLFTAAGLMSFGQALFVAVGAYVAGLIGLHAPGVPFLAAMALAALSGGAAAALVGFIALRRAEGVSFAMLTLVAAELLHIVITKTTFLGRNDGLTNVPRPALLPGLHLASDRAFYAFIVVACACLAAVLWWATHARWGRTLLAVRMDPQRAAFLAIDVHGYRMAAMILSGSVTAAAAALWGPWNQILTPDLAHWTQSTIPLLDTLLGGAAHFWGPPLGAVVFAALFYLLRDVAGVADLVAGCLLLAVVLAVPGGLLGIAARLARPGRARLLRPARPAR